MTGSLGILSLVAAACFCSVAAQTASAGCENATVGDIVFLVDGSSSITDLNFQEVRTFLRDIISGLDVGPRKVRVGLVQYGSEPHREFLLSDHADRRSLLAAVAQLPYRGGGTQTGKALRFLRASYFNESAVGGARPRVPQIAVVITDGESQDEVEVPALELRSHGVALFSVGVGDYNETQLRAIANWPPHHFLQTIGDFRGLQTLAGRLLETVCTSMEERREVLLDRFADTVFLVDSSLSARQFTLFKNELHRLIAGLDAVGQAGYRFGLAQYGDQVSLKFGLNAHDTKGKIVRAVKDFKLDPRPSQASNLGSALHYAASELFSASAGGRAQQGARQFLVVVQGRASDESVYWQARQVQATGVQLGRMGPPGFASQLDVLVGAGLVVDSLRATGLMDAITGARLEAVEAVAEDCKGANVADIVFIVEESGSIGSTNFQMMRDFLESVVRSLDVGLNRVRVGIVTYSTDPVARLYLDSLKYKADVLNVIQTLPYRRGNANTGAALSFTLKEVIQAQGGRKGVRKVAIVITDGKSTDPISDEAIMLRRAGVTVYAVGVKDANRTELEEMASDPSSRHVFNVDDFTLLEPLKQDLQKSVCAVIVDSATSNADVKEACKQKDESDIFFLVDDSGSITHDSFMDMKDFIAGFLRMFRIGPHQVRVGLAKYSDNATLEFDLTAHSTAKDAEAAVMAIHHRGGGTNTGKALTFMQPYFERALASRGVPEYLIVVTDGKSQDPVRAPAEQLRALGVSILAIGVKTANHTQLLEISGDANKVFQVNNFDALMAKRDDVFRELCAPEVCRDVPSDIIFLTDSSERIADRDFAKIKAFMKSVISRTLVGVHDVHVGVLQFSTQTRLEFPLTQYLDKEQMFRAIDGMQQMKRGVFTGRGVAEASQYFAASRGGRPALKQILVLLTYSRAEDEVRGPAEALRAQGVEVYAVGVMNASPTQLLDISGSLSNVFNRENANTLGDLEGQLALKFCDPQRDCKKIEKADIVFLVDGSTSISTEQFGSMTTFISSVVNRTAVGRDHTRFGAIVYSTEAEVQFKLNSFSSRGEVLQAVQKLTPPSGDTYTAHALAYSLKFFEEGQGGRKTRKVPQILMVITDGDATDHPRLQEASDLLRSSGVSVFGIGVRNASREQLEVMAGGDTSKVFYVDSFEELETLLGKMSSVLCNTTKPDCRQTDLVFLLDSSSSINPDDHRLMAAFTADVVRSFEVGEQLVHVGLAQFSTGFRHEFYLKDSFNAEEILGRIGGLEYIGGDTYIGAALDKMKAYFQTSAGARSSAPKTLVLISDGDSHDDVEDAADALKAMGVNILVVGIGDVHDLQLLQIAGTPEKLFNVRSFKELADIKTSLAEVVCKESSDQPRNCSIDVAVGFDVSRAGAPGETLRRHVPFLEEVARYIASLNLVCCTALDSANLGFYGVDVDGRSVFDASFEPYDEALVTKVINTPWSRSTSFTSALLSLLNEEFKSKSEAKVKVLLIFSDGLDDDVMTLEQESERLRQSGVSALLTVGLGAADPSQLLMVEFGRRYGYQDPLSISMPGVSSRVLQQMTAVVERVCCDVFCRCSGPEGMPGSPGEPGTKGGPGLQGQPGFPGEEGVPGERGFSGPSGPPGLEGCSGTRGLKGSRGFSGSRGGDGDDGLDGVNGAQGDAGHHGLLGERGQPGKPGVPGIRGEDGQEGERGLRGDPGEPGTDTTRPGPKGDAGSPGFTGEQGGDGRKGSDGVLGKQGPDGRQGPPGEKGTSGGKGAPGPAGLAGAQGPQGRRASTGEQGPKGAPGHPGRQGPPGPVGDPGRPGARGAGGLKGQPGDPGSAGSRGPPGPPGLAGDDGVQGVGPDGPKGMKGDPGFPGNPGQPGKDGEKGTKGFPGHRGNQGRRGNSGGLGEPGAGGEPGHPGHRGVKGHPGTRNISECQLVTFIRDSCACSQGESACPAYPTELVFGLDMSADVTAVAFERQRSALLSLLDDITVAESNCPTGARVAVVSFNSYTRSLIRFHEYHRQSQLRDAVKNIAPERTSSQRHLGAAMRYVGRNIFKRVRAGTTMRKVAVFFSGGPSDDVDDLLAAVMEYRALDIIPAIVSLRNAPKVRQIMEADDSGSAIFTVLGGEQNLAVDLRRVRNCAVCYDPCRRPDECSFIQEPEQLQQADVDLVLVLDGSREVQADEYAGARQLLGSVVERLAVAPAPGRPGNRPRVAAVQHGAGRAAQLEFGPRRYQTREQIKEHLLQMVQPQGGAAALGQTLDYALKEVLPQEARRRRVLLAVLAGQTAPRDRARLRYVSQKAKCDGAALFVVTVGRRYNRTQVEELASPPLQQHLLHLGGLRAEEQGYARRFFRVFLSALQRGLNPYPPPALRSSCSRLTEPDGAALFIGGEGPAPDFSDESQTGSLSQTESRVSSVEETE